MSENAPEELELKVCEACGRTDRWVSFPGNLVSDDRRYHFYEGRRCYGTVITLTYRLVRGSEQEEERW